MADTHRLSAEELAALDKQLDQQLSELQSTPKGKIKVWRIFSAAGLIKKILLSLLVLTAPFFVLIRTSVYLYENYQLNGWLALGGGILIALLLLLLYVTAFTLWFQGNTRTLSILYRAAASLLIAYIGVRVVVLFKYYNENCRCSELLSFTASYPAGNTGNC